jgi:hypothetical protein
MHVLEQRRPEMSSRAPQGLLACFEEARVRLTADVVNEREHDSSKISSRRINASSQKASKWRGTSREGGCAAEG